MRSHRAMPRRFVSLGSFWLLALILYSPLELHAQNAAVLTGLVTDEEGRLPLPKAVVSIESLNLSTLTNAKGLYILSIPLKAVQSMSVQVKVSAPGFAPKYATITLPKGTTTLNFVLSLGFQTQITVEPPESEPPPEISQVPEEITDDQEVAGFESVMEERRPWKGKFHFRMGVENGYDNNVFSLSSSNLAKFNTNLPKFQGLGAVNDTLIAVPVKFGYRLRANSGYETRFHLVADPQFYRNNSIRNYQLYMAGIEQKLPNHFELNLNFIFIPHYFHRRLALPPDQKATYVDATYSTKELHFSLEKGFSYALMAVISADYADRNYNNDFPFLDAKEKAVSFALMDKVSPSLRILGGVGYKRYLTAGHDDPIINYDTSYRRWSAFIELRIDPRTWVTIVPKVTYGPKTFLTDLPLDVDHFDRRDSSWGEELSCTFDLSKRFELHFKYQRNKNRSKRGFEDLEFPPSSEDRVFTGIFYEF